MTTTSDLEKAWLKAVSQLGVVDSDDWVEVFDQLTPDKWAKVFVDVYKPTLAGVLASESKSLVVGEGIIKYERVSDHLAKYIEVHVGQHIQGLSESARSATRVVLDQRYRAGENPRVAGRAIRPLIGLDPRLAVAVDRRAQELRKKGWKEERVLREQERYAQKLKRYRANNIARTEIADIRAESQLSSWNKGVSDGTLSPKVEKEWVCAADERTCNVCKQLHGQRVLLEAFFVVNGKQLKRPPAHASCRCPMVLHHPR